MVWFRWVPWVGLVQSPIQQGGSPKQDANGARICTSTFISSVYSISKCCCWWGSQRLAVTVPSTIERLDTVKPFALFVLCYSTFNSDLIVNFPPTSSTKSSMRLSQYPQSFIMSSRISFVFVFVNCGRPSTLNDRPFSPTGGRATGRPSTGQSQPRPDLRPGSKRQRGEGTAESASDGKKERDNERSRRRLAAFLHAKSTVVEERSYAGSSRPMPSGAIVTISHGTSDVGEHDKGTRCFSLVP